MRILRIRIPNTGLNKYFRFVGFSFSQCWESVKFWDLTADPTPSLILRMQKNNLFPYFLITCPQTYHLQSKKLIFLLKLGVKN
jgi:hypothetical protein